MVEIILRKDMQEYEVRPLFGFTYRQVLTGALIVAAATAIGVGLSRIGVGGTVMSIAVLVVCGAIGFVGLGTVHGLKFELWYRIWAEDRSWPRVATFASPTLSGPADRAKTKEKTSRAQRRKAKLDAAAAVLETETEDIEVR